MFRRSSKFSEVQSACKSLAHSPLAGVFQAGYVELNAQLRQGAQAGGQSSRPALRSFDALDRALLRASSIEVARLERRVGFLATTASLTPFIGLFGTVWGIMNAFAGIGAAGTTSLTVVAPGIAEALVATAAGLFAAIPAVYFYNYLTQRLKEIASTMDDFAMEFLNITERNFHLGSRNIDADGPTPAQAMAESRRRGRRVATSLSEINVIPLVDVMLVMLIVFMVAAPMMQRGLDVNLPEARRANPIEAQRLYVTVPLSFRADGVVQVDDSPVPFDMLHERIGVELDGRTDRNVLLRGDGAITYNELMSVNGQAEGRGRRGGRPGRRLSDRALTRRDREACSATYDRKTTTQSVSPQQVERGRGRRAWKQPSPGRAQRGPPATEWGEGVPASGRRGFGAQPQVTNGRAGE